MESEQAEPPARWLALDDDALPPPEVAVCRMPVPGIEAVRRTRPSAPLLTRYPLTPADIPMPDFEKLIRTPGAIFRDFRTVNPMPIPLASRKGDAMPHPGRLPPSPMRMTASNVGPAGAATLVR